MLSEKQLEIIAYLLKNSGYVTAESLAKVIDVSTRTVKRYIDSINMEMESQGVQIYAARGNGYQIKGSMENINYVIMNLKRQEGSQDRLKDLLLYLIQYDEITAENLAVKVNYSASTIHKLMISVKKILKKYDLELVSKPYYGMSIKGSEVNIRMLLCDYGFYVKDNKIYCELPDIKDAEFKTMKRIVVQHLKENKIVVADRDIHNLLSKLTLSVSRVRKGYSLISPNLHEKLQYENTIVIREILKEISESVQVVLSEEEMMYVYQYSGFMVYAEKGLTSMSGSEMKDFVAQALEDISKISGTKFNQQESIIDFLTTHISMLISRIHQNVKSANPILQHIKKEYALEMNYAIYLGKKIEDRFEIKINEDELAYLAIYFSAARKQKPEKKRVIILCQYGVGTSRLIGEQIREEFGELEISGIYPVHYLDLIEEQEVDFMISTVKIDNYKGKKPLIIIENFLEANSMEKIKHALYENDGAYTKLLSYFNQKAWYHIEGKNRMDVMNQIGTRMTKDGLINKGIMKSVIEREEISGTDIGNLVAIPHTIFTEDYPSIIGIGILKKPIKWDLEMVQLVLFICMNKTDQVSSMAFRQLYKVCKNINTVNQMIAAKSYMEFITSLKGE